MSSRSIGRGRCPKCGQEGVIVINAIGGQRYVYFRHGRRWCYIGPLREALPYLGLELQLEEITESTSRASKSSGEAVHKMQLRGIKLSTRLLLLTTLSCLALILTIVLVGQGLLGKTGNAEGTRIIVIGDIVLVNTTPDELIRDLLNALIYLSKHNCTYNYTEIECRRINETALLCEDNPPFVVDLRYAINLSGIIQRALRMGKRG